MRIPSTHGRHVLFPLEVFTHIEDAALQRINQRSAVWVELVEVFCFFNSAVLFLIEDGSYQLELPLLCFVVVLVKHTLHFITHIRPRIVAFELSSVAVEVEKGSDP